MNEKSELELGRIFKNTYNIQDYEPDKIGKMIMNIVRCLEAEELRDLREEKNK